MIDQILDEIEALDREIDRIEPDDMDQFNHLMQQRTAALGRLSKKPVLWPPEHVERLANLGRSTTTMQDRFQFLRGHAVEDMGLLQRHDQLLHQISNTASNPCYVDYSG